MGQEIRARAFAPGHITGFFQIFSNGSTGAGLNPARGASAEVRLTRGKAPGVSIMINGELTDARVSRRVMQGYAQDLEDCFVEVRHQIDYPIGYGMGMSAAGAFSLSLALNEVLGATRSYKECMEIARQSDIHCGTGLGDVVAQQFPGLMMGLPPYPSMQARQIPNTRKYVVCGFFEPIETARIIRDESWKQAINASGERCMAELSADCTVENFMRLSREFTFQTNLASPDVRRVMEEVPECSMAMLGQTVFAVCDDAERVQAAFHRYTHRTNIAELSKDGAKVL